MEFKLFDIFDTPLHIATEKGNTDFIMLLLSQNGIDIKIRNILHYISWIQFQYINISSNFYIKIHKIGFCF